MAVSKERRTLRIILQSLALVLFLGVLPFGSWYYLKNGLDYRVTTMSQLKKYGQLPVFSDTTFVGDTLSDAALKGKMRIVNLLNLQDAQMSQTFGEVLEKLRRQFKERKDLVFLVYVLDSTATGVRVAAFAQQYKLDDPEQFFFVPAPADSIARIQQRYFMPQEATLPYFSLSDIDGMVRHYYDVRKTEDLKKLVAHTALLLPLEKHKEITLKPTEQN